MFANAIHKLSARASSAFNDASVDEEETTHGFDITMQHQSRIHALDRFNDLRVPVGPTD